MTGRNPKVLVVGAAGRYGGLVVGELVARGASVRGFVRSAEQAGMVKARGAQEIAIGDLRDADSVKTALQDIDAVYYIAPVLPGDEAPTIGRALVAAAKQAGVKRFVFSSVIHSIISALDNHIQKVPVEEAIIQSGMDFTILQPSHFFQNIIGAWANVVENGIFSEAFSAESKLAYVDYRDVAEVAAIALTDGRLRNGTFMLCAEAGLNRHEVCAAMSEVLGRPVEAESLDVDAWLADLGVPLDDYTRQAVVKLSDYYDNHGLVGNPLVLTTILGREPRKLHEFLADMAAGVPTIATS